MTGINHVVTGAVVATMVSQPLVAVPLAFLSHFIMDTLPHYGHRDDRYWVSRAYKRVVAIDTCLVLAFFGMLLVFQPHNWAYIALISVVALAPDILWLPYYIHDLRSAELKQRSPLVRFLKRIQLGEFPRGIYIELAWLGGFTFLLQRVMF